MKILQVIKYFILFVFSLPFFVFGKTPKPKLVVYGSNLSAYVAALQASSSGVQTLWVNPHSYSFKLDSYNLALSSDSLLDGGVVRQFIKNKKDNTDSITNYLNFEKQSASNLWNESNPFLTILNGEDIIKVEYKKSWKLTLSNKESYNLPAVLDASEGNTLAERAGLSNIAAPVFKKSKDISIAESRNIVLIGQSNGQVFVSGLPDLLTQQDNFFELDINGLPMGASYSFQIAYAQTMGAIASYCSFFKTTADKIDLRTLQNEILIHQGRLLPVVDIHTNEEQHFEHLQHMFLAGIFPLKVSNNNLIFAPSDSVRLADVKTVINQYYSRAQLWFVDNNPEYFSVQDALNLIKFTAFRAEELDVEVKKMWNKELSFEGEYDPAKLISKYEFAVLFDKYATPFIKKVSQDGETIYR